MNKQPWQTPDLVKIDIDKSSCSNAIANLTANRPCSNWTPQATRCAQSGMNPYQCHVTNPVCSKKPACGDNRGRTPAS